MGPLDQRLPAEDSYVVLSQRLKQASDDWYIGKSDIAGQGVFAGKDYDPGDSIGLAMTDGDEDEFGAKIWNLTELARYCNHQNANNVEIRKNEDGDRFQLVAIEPIGQDEELVSNYWQVAKAKGPHSTMLWEGKPVPTSDLQDYTEKGASAMIWLFTDEELEKQADLATLLDGLREKSQLAGSRGRAHKYGRPEPEGRDYDRLLLTDDPKEQEQYKRQLEQLIAGGGYTRRDRPGGFLTAASPDEDISVYPTSKLDDIHKAWELIEGGMSKDEAWAQVEKEKDVYVQSAVPAASRDLVRKHGLLSSQALLNNPEALEAFLGDRVGTDWEEDEEEFKQRIAEKLKDTLWGDSIKGPSVFFGDPDPEKITDAHPMLKLKAETLRVNLSKLMRDYPKTRIAGTELQPYDPEGPEHQGALRHYDIDMDKVREYAATDPKELWKHYDNPEGTRYASDVPHAQIITPSGSIDPKYIDFGGNEEN